MKEHVNRQVPIHDRIVMRTATGSEDIITETPIMDLPKNPINYGARPAAAENPAPSKVLPEGLNRLDLRTVTADEDSQITMEGPIVNGTVVVELNEEGIGKVALDEKREVIVYAAALTQKTRGEKEASGERDQDKGRNGFRKNHTWGEINSSSSVRRPRNSATL